VDTATLLSEQGADSPGAFDVPANVSHITEVRIAAAADYTADTILGWTTGIQLSGGGIQVGYGAFPGPFGWTVGTTNVSPGVDGIPHAVYQTKIPVVPGGSIDCRGTLLGEDCGAVRITVALVYDGIPGRIVDMDYREESLTAANTLVSLGNRQGAASGDFRPTSTIGEVYVGGGLKAVAGPLACTTGYHLTGAGLRVAGNYKFIGLGYNSQDDIATLGHSGGNVPMRYRTNIAVKRGSTIRCQAQMIEDDVGTVFAIIGLGYI
jgi:hypothetical protein